MSRIASVVAAIVVTLAGGCTVPVGPAPAVTHPPTEVAASAGRTWDAVIDQFAGHSIPIATIERVSGLIVSRELGVDQATSFSSADCGSDGAGGRYYATRVSYNALVRGDSSHSTVHITAEWSQPYTIAGVARILACTSKGTWEASLEQQIRAAAEAKASASR